MEKKKRKTAAPKKSEKQEECDSLAADLSRVLGINVSIRPKSVGGELVLFYETLEQLDGLIRRLNARPQDKKMQTAEDDVIQNVDGSFSDTLDDDVISLDKLK